MSREIPRLIALARQAQDAAILDGLDGHTIRSLIVDMGAALLQNVEPAAVVADAYAAEMDALYQEHLAAGRQDSADRVAARSRAAAEIAARIRAIPK